ncbi:MAG: S41 family peptidase [Elusimicrobiaceae bacterium]|nr:S41 family peptidase [Elusimicrobiaceae bacterium]
MRALYVAVQLFALFCVPSAANEWQDYARRDLKFIYKTIADNHPGPKDRENPWFRRYLNSGYKKAEKDIAVIKNHTDYKALLRRYAGGFKDVHISLMFRPYSGYTMWPGFIIEKQDGEYRVIEVEPEATIPGALPEKGWTLRSCDGLTPGEIMKKHIFPFSSAKSNLPAEWTVYSRELLLYAPNAWKPMYQECVFSDGRKETALPLSYRTITLDNLKTKTDYKRDPLEVTTPADGIVWITLPSFALDPAGEIKMRAIIASMPQYRGAKYAVFDVRGNSGGSSVWGNELIESLYGSGFTNYLRRQTTGLKPVYAEFRASRENLQYLTNEMIPAVKKAYGTNSIFLKQFTASAKNMAVALKHGRAFARKGETADFAGSPQPAAAPGTASSARAVILIDGKCISSCLSFVDLASRLPDAVLAGQPTNADTNYTELREKRLPSDIGILMFAIAVYRNRTRSSDFYYSPQYLWEKSIDESAAVREWILKEVIPDLHKQNPS